MTARFLQLKFSKLLPAVLLGVLVFSLVPIPAKAAVSINFDVNPKQVPRGENSLNFTLNVDGITPSICGGNDLYAQIDYDEDSPPTTVGAYSAGKRIETKIVDLTKSAFSWNPRKSFDFDDDTIYFFIGSAVCKSSRSTTLLKKSSAVSVKTAGVQGGDVINKSKLQFNWTTSAKTYVVSDKAQYVDIKLLRFQVRVEDKIPKEFPEKGDLLAESDNATERLTIKSFDLAIDRYGRNPRDWGCDGFFINVCTRIPFQVFDLSNPQNAQRTIRIPINGTPRISGQQGGLSVAEEEKAAGIGIALAGMIKAQGNNVDFPLVTPGQVAIKFDSSLTPGQQREEGGVNESGTGGGAEVKSPTSPLDVAGGSLLSLINIILGAIISILRWIVWTLGTWIFVPLLDTTMGIAVSEITSPIVRGWEIVRDLVNMFFILALIAIGFGTMLRVESYNYKKLLVNLIVMALLVNFSLVIARIILEVADTVQFGILPKNEAGATVRDLFKRITTDQIPNITAGFLNFKTAGALATTMSIIFQFVLELGVVLVFAAMAIFMLIRHIAIWILLILSPFAYALAILPATKGVANKWWSSFMKYVLFAPIIAFFLQMTGVIYGTAFKVLPRTETFNPSAKQLGESFFEYLNQLKGTTGDVTFTASLQLMIIYMVILAFMWAGLFVTKSMGIAGAGAIVGFAERGLKAPLALGWKGTKALGGLVARTYSGYFARKGFSALERERAAEQAKTVKMAERETLLAKLAPKREQAVQLRKEAEGYRKREQEAKGQGLTAEAQHLGIEAFGREQEAARLEREMGAMVAPLEGEIKALEGDEKKAKAAKRNYALAQFLNPIAVVKGWKARSEEKERRAYLPAEGYVYDMLNKFLPTEWGMLHGRGWTLGRETEHGFLGKFAIIREESKALEGLRINREYASYIKDKIAKTGEFEDIMGMELLINRNRNQDDFHNIYGGSPEQPYTYSPFIDLEYNTKRHWQRLSKQERELLASQILEQEEELGRWRSLGFYNENTHLLSNDLSYLEDAKVLEEEMRKLAQKLRTVDSEGWEDLARRVEAVRSVDDIRKDREVYEAVVSSNMDATAAIKKRRGASGKWAREGFEAAAVRYQDPNLGWTGYTPYGKMAIYSTPETVFQAWIGRVHEGQPRALVAGGAMVDRVTGEIRLPTRADGVYWKAWEDLVRIKPQVAAATWSYFQDADRIRNNYDEAVRDKTYMTADGPSRPLRQQQPAP